MSLSGEEWDPLFAYAASQSISPSQAVRELLMTAVITNAQSATYIATARATRKLIMAMMLKAASRAMRAAIDEINVEAVTRGVSIEDLG